MITVQALLLAIFSVFASFNYLYGFASLFRPRIPRTRHSSRRVAVVVVSFNEKYVLSETLHACDALSYPNKVIVLADDSTDPDVVASLRGIARARGCTQLSAHPHVQEVPSPVGPVPEPIEIWQSPGFVFFHRPANVGFKGGSVAKVLKFLESQGIELMYLLDADWRPQMDALERALEVLEADPGVAFVQTKRISTPTGMTLFQRYVALIEEGCYYVDFEGRQVLGHPVLFSGCCTLFRLDAVKDVGGFTPGHLTEDLDLTDRLWLAGWKGIYLGDVVNYGEVPFTYDHYRRQQERWAAGSARAFRDFAWPLLKTNTLGWFSRLSALRQNAYFITTLLTGAAIMLGMMTIAWMVVAGDSYEVEAYLYFLDRWKAPYLALLYWCILSNLVEPLIMVVVKKRDYRSLLHIPMMVWYAWSVIPTYIIGNLKGLTGVELDWFRTPKFVRGSVGAVVGTPIAVRAGNIAICVALIGFYFIEAWHLGWFDEFALLLIPAFLLAAIRG